MQEPSQILLDGIRDCQAALQRAGGMSSPVLRGESPNRRDFSSESVQKLTNNALAPIEDKAADVLREWGRLFGNMIVGFGRVAPMPQISKLVGPAFTDDQIEDYKIACLSGMAFLVQMEKNSLLGYTRQQRKDAFERMQETGIMNDPIARALFGEQTGIWVSTEDRLTVLKANAENKKIAKGAMDRLDYPSPFDNNELFILIHKRLSAAGGFPEERPERWHGPH